MTSIRFLLKTTLKVAAVGALLLTSACFRMEVRSVLNEIEDTVAEKDFSREHAANLKNGPYNKLYDWSHEESKDIHNNTIYLVQRLTDRVVTDNDRLNEFLYQGFETIEQPGRMPDRERIRVEIYRIAQYLCENSGKTLDAYEGIFRTFQDLYLPLNNRDRDKHGEYLYEILNTPKNDKAMFLVENRMKNVQTEARAAATFLLLRMDNTTVIERLMRELKSGESRLAPAHGMFLVLCMSGAKLSANIETLLQSEHPRARHTGYRAAEWLLWRIVPPNQGGNRLKDNQIDKTACQKMLADFKAYRKTLNEADGRDLLVASFEAAMERYNLEQKEKDNIKDEGRRNWIQAFQSRLDRVTGILPPKDKTFTEFWKEQRTDLSANSPYMHVIYGLTCILSPMRADGEEKYLAPLEKPEEKEEGSAEATPEE